MTISEGTLEAIRSRSKTCVIFDIDNTMFDVNGLSHLTEGSSVGPVAFETFHEAAVYAPAVENVVVAARAFQNCMPMFVLTARHEKYREETVQLLDKHGIYPDMLLMRDVQGVSSAQVKKSMVATLIDEGFYPVMAFEDDEDTIAMYENDYKICTYPGIGWTKPFKDVYPYAMTNVGS